jgi:chromosome segregation ATPase
VLQVVELEEALKEVPVLQASCQLKASEIQALEASVAQKEQNLEDTKVLISSLEADRAEMQAALTDAGQVWQEVRHPR